MTDPTDPAWDGNMCPGGMAPDPRYQRDARIRLVSTTDPHTRSQPGAEGIVTGVDALGTLQVRWDDGSRLGLVHGEDEWEWIDPAIPNRSGDR